MRVNRWWIVCLLVTVLIIAGTVAVSAQDKTLYWERFDVDITVLDNGDFQVVEHQEIAFTSGSFTYGYRNIPLDRVEQITNLEVWEGDTRYVEQNSENPNTFQSWTESGELKVKFYFSETSNQRRTWTLRYTVKGGLRVYEGGDQLFWKAIYSDRAFPVRNARVVVHLPAAFSPDELMVETYESDASMEQVDPQTVIFKATREIGANQGLEIRVQFPHGIVSAQEASWQAAADRQTEYEENWKPLVDLGVAALSALVLVGGLIGVYVLWYTKGRDKPSGLVAEFITEPPSDLPPGAAGTLLDESADMEDIVATIVDLARRGILTMEELEEPGAFGFGKKKDFRYRLVSSQDELLPYEKAVVKGVFKRSSERLLSDLRNKFYKSVPKIQEKLYTEVVDRGFFPSSPDKTRKAYAGMGIGGLILAACIGFAFLSFLVESVSTIFCLPLSLGVACVGLLIISRFMPARTAKGSEAAAKWEAFKRYLEDVEKYENVEEATQLFDRYLPYAIAFGLGKSWIKTPDEGGQAGYVGCGHRRAVQKPVTTSPVR